jgi:hypothetical protein
VSLATLYLIDTYLGNTAQVPVLQAPFDYPFHRTKNFARTRAETFCRLTPTQTPCPVRKKLAILYRLGVLAFTPGNLFRNNAMVGTSDATHVIGKEKRNVPKRNKLEIAWSIGCIISGTPSMAFRTDTLRILARNNLGNKTLRVIIVSVEKNIGENEGLVIGNKIQYSLYEHLGERIKGSITQKHFTFFLTGMFYDTMMPFVKRRQDC